MGNLLGGGSADDEEEELEQQRLSVLKKWRPEGADAQTMMGVKRRKGKDKHDEDSEDGSGGGEDSESGSSSVGAAESEDSEAEQTKEADETKSEGSKGEGESSSEGSDDDKDKALAKHDDDPANKKLVVHMEYEPLLSLHEPLGKLLEEPADIWAHTKHTKKQERAERAAMEDAINANRQKAMAVAEWMAEMGIEDCMLKEAAAGVREEPDELRYALNASKRFEVDDREGIVRKTLLQGVLDVMTSDIETVQEVIEKLVSHDADEEAIRQVVKDSGGELRLKTANDIILIERVNVEAEMKQRRLLEREQRMQAREARKKGKQKGGKLALFGVRRSAEAEEEEEDAVEQLSSSSSEDDGPGNRSAVNREAEKKALAFRRLQVQRKIEDFLWLYRNGQNLQKINSKGRRYNRRVFIDTTKRALVVQGASGPRFFPFINMKEVDIDTHTTKEGRVETLVICAMEKGGRIYKELTLAFPDQAKANNFVNCLTLFSLALRSGAK